MKKLRAHISDVDAQISELREELLADIDIMLSKKKKFIFKKDQPLVNNDYAIDSVCGEDEKLDIDEPEVSGLDNDGRRYITPIRELDTDVLLKIADIMCKQLEK